MELAGPRDRGQLDRTSIEPIVQVIARPDEPYAGELPNDDAQSLVFDDSVLFRRDKFSGLDRVEGGTRVNYGIRYIGTFNDDLVLEGLFGQSWMLAGTELVRGQRHRGCRRILRPRDRRLRLCRPRVASARRSTSVSLRGRFDEENFDVQRAEIEASQTMTMVADRLGRLRLHP